MLYFLYFLSMLMHFVVYMFVFYSAVYILKALAPWLYLLTISDDARDNLISAAKELADENLKYVNGDVKKIELRSCYGFLDEGIIGAYKSLRALEKNGKNNISSHW